MKKAFQLFAALFAAVLLGSCHKESKQEADFVVDYFAFQAEEDGEWGLMDSDGKVVVKPRYDNMPTCVINDMFSVYDEDDAIFTLYQIGKGAKPKKIGTYKDIGAYTGKLCPVVDDDNNMSYIDKDGKKVIDLKKLDGEKVMSAFNFFNGRAMVMLENRMWGFIDESGNAVIPCKYADAWNFWEGLAIVYYGSPEEDEDAKWAVIDTEGKVLFTKKFSDMRPSSFRFCDGYLVVSDSNERNIIINKQGEVVKKLKSGRFPAVIYNGLFTVYNAEDETYGLMNLEGEMLVKDEYDQLNYNGKLLVGKNDEERPSILSTTGEKITRLPEGLVTLFDPEYRNYDKRMLVGEYGDGFTLVDGEGNKIATESEIFSTGLTYYWGATVPGAYGEFDGEGEPDYDEEVDFDEEVDEDGAVG